VDIRPPIPFPSPRQSTLEAERRGPDRIEAGLEDWVWAMRLEEELDYALLIRDAAATRRQRLVGRVRVVALLALVASIVAVVRVTGAYGVGVGLAAMWAAPVLVLGVVLFAEKVLLRFSR
jgi:hypothetical protein